MYSSQYIYFYFQKGKPIFPLGQTTIPNWGGTMHRLALFFSLSLLAVTSLDAKEICPADSVYEFVTDQEYQTSGFGYFADFDYTENIACTEKLSSCEKFQLNDNGYDGFYEPHTVYYITYGTRVIYAKTSLYFESTYGQSFGIADAELRRDEIFQNLSIEAGCAL